MKLLELGEIKKDLPSSFKFYLSFDITSKTADHRLLIRKSLTQRILELYPDTNDKSLLNLDQLPSTSSINISVSHCHSSSGFAFVDKKVNVGIDLESQERITDKVIGRIAKESEIGQCPDPKALLSAKESCWKAVNSFTNVATISQIETTHWSQETSEWFRFNATISGQSLDGQGFLTQKSGTYVSIFLSPSTFV